MYEAILKELAIVSQTVGNCPDYVQGGGGNTSVKLNDTLMAIKASGYRLNQITSKDGFVIVDYKNIKQYYNDIDINLDIDFEKDSSEITKKNIVEIEGMKKLRPSVEVGFHSILKKHVIHTHSVYANILCCSIEGKELTKKILDKAKHDFLWIPYINPGFSLTIEIQKQIKKYQQQYNKFPQIIFMENHGLIVTDDDYNECINLHSEVNDLIKKELNPNQPYPEIKFNKVDENTFESGTKYIIDFLKNNNITQKFFNEFVLYPDQLVYLNSNITENKISIGATKVIYKTTQKEAQTIGETLLAFIYVINEIKEKDFKLKVMTHQQIDFINNWESEKYRKNLLKK